MYLPNGREIYESDKYPGYYIDANTGNFCDENGNYIGGNIDDGDKPGRQRGGFSEPETVFISKTGHQYYPFPTKIATIPIGLYYACKKGYKPSAGYNKYIARQFKKRRKCKN